MTRYKVEFEVDIPDNVDHQEVRLWLQYKLGIRGDIEIINPLVDMDLEAVPLTVCFIKVRKRG